MPFSLLEIGLLHYLVLSAALFCIGLAGVLVRKNIIIILMSIELMLNAVNLSFIAFSYYHSNLNGQVMVFFVMTVAAAEAGVGLSLVITVFKKWRDINLNLFERLRG